MPAFRIPLGSVKERLLRRSEVFLSVHRSVEPFDGLHDCGAPNTSSVGSPNRYEEEASRSRYVLYGNGVSVPQVSKREQTCAHIQHSICAITIVRIKVTTSINTHHRLQQQYASFALLTCLEALLGVINACLPVLKPIVNKIGATSMFSSFWRNNQVAISRRQLSPGPPRTGHLRREREKHLHISPPRQIVHQESLDMFSPDLPIDAQAPSIPLPSFSWRPLSRFYVPSAGWEYDPSDLRQDNGTGTTTNMYVERRQSEGDSPTLPWQH